MLLSFKGARWRAGAISLVLLLGACGGGGGASNSSPGTESSTGSSAPMAAADAFRLADQATFGASEALLAELQTRSAADWIADQMKRTGSRYTAGQGGAIHQQTSTTEFCNQPANKGPNCWRDWYSTTPLEWDFYRNATTQGDQLRQRVALALQQILVVSNLEVTGTYGFRRYHNNLLANAFGNYRDVLRLVTLSPLMGDFLNNANNDQAAPNENYARELLQLFSIGTCALNADGSLAGGHCTATYANDTVRAYAYALTGWTYPAGGQSPWNCSPKGANCRYYDGDMVPVASLHDSGARTLLSGVSVPAGTAAPAALELVLDSLLKHPNTAPFVGRRLIQHLVSSNPSPAYVQRVAQAFAAGRYNAQGQTFGTGAAGDLAATVAAVLLDSEARGDTAAGRSAGKLREPVLVFTGVLRALNGKTDGDALGWWWGEQLSQHLFRPPSVFNFYPPDFPVAGTALVGPAFGLLNANTGMQRLNYLTFLLFNGGAQPSSSVPSAVGTQVDLTAFQSDAADAAALVDRLARLCCGNRLPAEARSQIVGAVNAITAANDSQWQRDRVRQAGYLLFASPTYQVQR